MDADEQIRTLCGVDIPDFESSIEKAKKRVFLAGPCEVLQINVGRKCNLFCRHCHVEASSERHEVMDKKNLKTCFEIIRDTESITTVDITGGAPELNPNLGWFIEKVSKFGKRIIVRSNLSIFEKPEYADFPDFYAKHWVELAASLPSVDREGTDRVRGEKTFDAVIDAIRKLNRLGYGKEGSGLVLNLVHNPVGAFLPGSQKCLEKQYKKKLRKNHGVVFNKLFVITNLPVGRFLPYLLKSGNLPPYMRELYGAFNPKACDNVMCKNTISVSWDGYLYDCDFNQMLGLKVDCTADSLKLWDITRLAGRRVRTLKHCYGCVAGAGSSCQGETT